MLSKDQDEAISTIKSGNGPFFVTGPAGSGKSFIIDYIRKEEGCAVTATTGISAQLIHGRTIHSFCSIHPQLGVVPSRKASERIRGCKVLVIDEISMSSSTLLEQVYERFEYSGYHPKLIVVGDLLQLPPVEGKYVYESELWKDFTTIKLTTMHRQNEANFIRALGDLRIGKISKRLSKLIKSRTVQQLPDNCTKLFAYRDDVERINISKLNELPGQTMCAQWDIIEGQENADPGKTRFQQKLFLKDGARIVLLTNDKEDRWVNGSTGEVVSIDSEAVHIRLDENEQIVRVLEHQEEVLDADGKSLFMVRQYPIQLAWALTIHKSQGMSMDRVGVNLNGHFASGMTYVAMSRSRTKNGLFLIGEISSIEVNEKALDICK